MTALTEVTLLWEASKHCFPDVVRDRSTGEYLVAFEDATRYSEDDLLEVPRRPFPTLEAAIAYVVLVTPEKVRDGGWYYPEWTTAERRRYERSA